MIQLRARMWPPALRSGVTFGLFALVYPVLFEAIPDWRVGPVPLRWEGILLPTSLLFGASAMAGVSAGSVAINLYLRFRSLEEIPGSLVVVQFLAFFISLALAYRVLRATRGFHGYFPATAVLAIGLTASMGTYWSIITSRWESFLSIMVMTMVPTNLAGPWFMEAVDRLRRAWAGEGTA